MTEDIKVAAESDLDSSIVSKIASSQRVGIREQFDKNGKTQLDKKLKSYLKASLYEPWFVLRDLDMDSSCAPKLKARLLGTRDEPKAFCLRIAVREVESWLMADRESFAKFFKVGTSHIPPDPEIIDDPKRMLCQLARRSQDRGIRNGVPPEAGSGRNVGPAYSAYLLEFISDHWRPVIAAQSSPSLSGTLRRMKHFAKHGTWR